MNRFLLLPFLLSSFILSAQNKGYEIKITFKPFKNQYIYLGHYSGKSMPIDDSIKLNDKSEGVFKGTKPLGGGIYIIGFPSKDRYFEVLVDKQQHFTILADTADLDNRKFVNSPDNTLFIEYQQAMRQRGEKINQLRQQLAGTHGADSVKLSKDIAIADSAISAYRKNVVAKNPNTLLATLLHLMEEPKIPPAAEHPGGKYDSAYAYRYFKNHYWDNINFFDERLARTPSVLFEDRIDKYFKTLVYHNADSVNKEIDWMLGYASVSDEMTRFLLVKFINRYLKQQYMWEDAVFVHLFEKYFSQKEYSWLTPEGKKIITERAYNLMANIMGNPAENILLPDSTGTTRNLYEVKSPYTLVAFYDPNCGHCKEVLPKLDSMYRTKWKADSLHIYAVAKEVDASPADWKKFISNNHLEGWTHVFYSKAEETSRINASIPSYSQLYDVQSFPTLYLLDRDKRIIAKKLTWEQINEILDYRKK